MLQTVPVVQRIEQGFPKDKTTLLPKSADVISCAQIAAIEPVELLLGSSRVITNLHIFTHPGDTTGDTKFQHPFSVTRLPSVRALTTLQNITAPAQQRHRGRNRALFFVHFWRGQSNEFLKPRIIPERIERWIEPEQRRSEGHVRSQRATVRCRE